MDSDLKDEGKSAYPNERRAAADRRVSFGRRATDGKERDALVELVSSALAEKLKSEFTVPSEQHKQHHDYIAAYIERNKAKSAFYTRIAESVTVWAVIAAITGGLGIMGVSFLEYLKARVK